MKDTTIKNDLLARIDELSPELQRRLLDFASTLSPRGTEGRRLLRFEGAIPSGELELMSKAIGEGCEKVDIGEW